MQAKHGLASPTRKRGRLIGLCMTLALALSALVFGPAAARAETTDYVALGDSISFGYSQERFNVNFPAEAPAFFEEGFDHWFRQDLAKATEVGKGVVDVNDACPGETSNGLIGENPALGGELSTEPPGGEGGIQGLKDWHPCAYNQLDGLPLHNSLGTHSQLEEILALLKEGHPAHPVRAITLNIGSNDELAAIATCKKEVTEEFEKEGKSKYGETPEGAVITCIGSTAINVTIPHILKNIGDTLGVIDSTAPGGGHYTGAIILLGFYNPDAFVLPGSDQLQKGVNTAVEEHILPLFPNVTFANPFPVINKGALIESKAAIEQAAICKYTEMCNPNVQVAGGKPEGKDGDIHPSLTGYKELATLVNKAWLANPAK
jgi:hypothetical protein